MIESKLQTANILLERRRKAQLICQVVRNAFEGKVGKISLMVEQAVICEILPAELEGLLDRVTETANSLAEQFDQL
jgi:hypothetical protein